MRIRGSPLRALWRFAGAVHRKAVYPAFTNDRIDFPGNPDEFPGIRLSGGVYDGIFPLWGCHIMFSRMVPPKGIRPSVPRPSGCAIREVITRASCHYRTIRPYRDRERRSSETMVDLMAPPPAPPASPAVPGSRDAMQHGDIFAGRVLETQELWNGFPEMLVSVVVDNVAEWLSTGSFSISSRCRKLPWRAGCGCIFLARPLIDPANETGIQDEENNSPHFQLSFRHQHRAAFPDHGYHKLNSPVVSGNEGALVKAGFYTGLRRFVRFLLISAYLEIFIRKCFHIEYPLQRFLHDRGIESATCARTRLEKRRMYYRRTRQLRRSTERWRA